MLYPPLAPDPLVQHWIARHQHPVSFVLHMVGIPPTLLGALLVPVSLGLLSVNLFVFALALFVGGYLIQFLGHAFEGTDPGEIIVIKRRLGWSYVEFAAQRKSRRGVA